MARPRPPANGAADGPEWALLAGQFLRRCLASRWHPPAIAEAQALAEAPGFDWEAVASLAQQEQVAPLLYAALREQPWAPSPLLGALRQAYMRNASRNALLLAELEAVLASLAGAGMAVVALKGAALVARVYGNLALRPMVDLDLLVPREEMAAARDLLLAAGYRAPQAEPAAGLALEFENELLLWKADPIDLRLELHWSLFDSPYYQERLPMAWFWETATRAQVGGTGMRILGPEAELLHLCGHLTLHHRGEGLLWQHDIAAAMAHGRDTLDWDLLLAQARACELVLALQALLPGLAKAWDAPAPEAILRRLAGMAPSPGEARAFAELTAERRPVLQRFQADLAGIPRWRDRLRYAWANVAPAPAYMSKRYEIRHRALLPAYYPYRWFIGLREALQSWQRG